MNAMKSIEIIRKYTNCPDCGNDTIGNGEGAIIIDEDTFTRKCKCGFKITVDKDGNEVEPTSKRK